MCNPIFVVYECVFCGDFKDNNMRNNPTYTQCADFTETLEWRCTLIKVSIVMTTTRPGARASITAAMATTEYIDLQHNLFILTLDNRLGLAPPNGRDSTAKRVRDIGTGIGIWATDFADEHPNAQVVGVDLSPIQSDFVPPNVEFFIDDIEEPWTFTEPFDYIHSRMMTFSIKSWPNLENRIYANLLPGGYVELLEIDLFAKSDDNSLNEAHQPSQKSFFQNRPSIPG
ncbi:hypothetical protein FBEOM_6159 [Fusarium beomiforme]|uniref:Methyltransferase n=1 Tax=Fusarium beomiforme TaxID=44412 RepID=A0A9P5AK23_9HYPO|nr:hypothetical protein FBEOM_6159 [Fusarium beomiforme]